MQPSARQQELERLYNARKGHVPHISISDDSHHVTEAIGSYYDNDGPTSPVSPNGNAVNRPYSFVTSPGETYESKMSRRTKRNGSYFDMDKGAAPPPRGEGREKMPSPTEREAGGRSPKSVQRMSSLGSEGGNGNNGSTTPAGSPGSPPGLSRPSSTEAAMQSFPLNDIDYESSPAAVAQELSNLQAIRRMSMNVDKSDPDLPSFGGVVPTVAPKRSEDADDTSRLFWVPARLHPELAPKEFKTFVEDKVERIKRRSGDSDSLSVDGLERSNSGSSSLRRKKSMLSHQIDTKGDYEDGAERLERKRSKRMSEQELQQQMDLSDLEELVSDPAQLMRRMSMDNARRSHDSGIEVPPGEDMPILPPVGQSLKRSTRTTYRRGSLKKGERVPFSRRAQHRQTEPESDDSSGQPSTMPGADEPVMGLTRVQTEPIPPPERASREAFPSRTESSLRWREQQQSMSQTTDDIPTPPVPEQRASPQPAATPPEREDQGPPRPQPRQFQSRLASGPGRTTAQLPGYNNPNPLPNIIETLPDGTKVPVAGLGQTVPERKSSHELPRPFSRGGAHTRPVPGREHQRSSTLDDISSHPSPLPGSGTTRTDTLTMVPTFEDKKTEKKDGPRKSSWKWILGSDDDKNKDKTSEERTSMDSTRSSKASKLSKSTNDKGARLDVLQSSIEGNVPPRGRESLVLNREDLKLDEERKKETKKASESKRDKEGKDSGLLSAIFGTKKKTSDSDLKQKHRKSDRHSSPDPAIVRILKPDIDYNWTRFSILEERAIYRMAHIKLANPRRALYSQVLLSNFMYSYLAKVQMMHPQVQIPAAHQQKGRKGQQQQEEQQQQQQQQNQPVEYSQYQRWQQQQDREAESGSSSSSARQQPQQKSNRTSLEIATGGGAAPPVQQQYQYQQQQQQQSRTSYDIDDDGYDARSSEEYEYDHDHRQQHLQQQQQAHQQQQYQAAQARSGVGGGGGGSAGGRTGYSVAGTHDYLGYPKDQQPFGGSRGLWDNEEKSEELW